MSPVDKKLVHFAPFGRPRTLCGLHAIRNGLRKTNLWPETTCPTCLMEAPK